MGKPKTNRLSGRKKGQVLEWFGLAFFFRLHNQTAMALNILNQWPTTPWLVGVQY
jgi:hypothetical protein